MKMWTVAAFWQGKDYISSEDLGVYGTKSEAIAAAHAEMGPEAWEIAYLTADEIHFVNGQNSVVVESIYTG